MRNTEERIRFENADIFWRTGLGHAPFDNWTHCFNYQHVRDKEKEEKISNKKATAINSPKLSVASLFSNS